MLLQYCCTGILPNIMAKVSLSMQNFPTETNGGMIPMPMNIGLIQMEMNIGTMPMEMNIGTMPMETFNNHA